MRLAVYCYDINNIKNRKKKLCEMHVDGQNGQGEALSPALIILKMIWEKKMFVVGELQSSVIQDIP